MKIEEFLNRLDQLGNDWDYFQDDSGIQTWYFKPKDDPLGKHFTWEAIEREDWGVLFAHMKGGRDVKHITRVTGYFSDTTGWNAGKRAELGDRHRTGSVLLGRDHRRGGMDNTETASQEEVGITEN